MSVAPARGEVWTIDLEPRRGREQGGTRPAVVVSADRLNRGRSQLVVVVPLTSVAKRAPLHVDVQPPEGGLRRPSYAKPEDVRSVSVSRLGRRTGTLAPATMRAIEDGLRLVLDL